MARVRVGDIELGYREWGSGPTTVVFIHGNLAAKDWIELAATRFPSGFRVIGIDWRGCGESDRVQPFPDFSNYSIAQHAEDMLGALDALNIPFCHLATHSTGGIISTRMLLAQPQRFGRVLSLAPVSPESLPFSEQQISYFRLMSHNKGITRTVMASVAPSLFHDDSLKPGSMPLLKGDAGARGDLFERVVDLTFSVSQGIWVGTPVNLDREHKSGMLGRRMSQIRHPHLVIWGDRDHVIPVETLARMAAAMPDCKLVRVPGIGHSMNLEAPDLYAGYFGAWFSAH